MGLVSDASVYLKRKCKKTYIKLPALNVLACVFACDHHDELRYLAANHPFVQLGHDLLDIGFDLAIRGDKHSETIFLDSVVNLESLLKR